MPPPLTRAAPDYSDFFLAGSTRSQNKDAIAAGRQLELLGQTFKARSGNFMIAFGWVAVIGLGLILLAVLGLVRPENNGQSGAARGRFARLRAGARRIGVPG